MSDKKIHLLISILCLVSLFEFSLEDNWELVDEVTSSPTPVPLNPDSSDDDSHNSNKQYESNRFARELIAYLFFVISGLVLVWAICAFRAELGEMFYSVSTFIRIFLVFSRTDLAYNVV